MTIADELLETLRTLPLDQQRQVLNFARLLGQKTASKTTPKSSSWRNHPCIGLWKDRQDMQDSVAWVKQLREQEWHRY